MTSGILGAGAGARSVKLAAPLLAALVAGCGGSKPTSLQHGVAALDGARAPSSEPPRRGLTDLVVTELHVLIVDGQRVKPTCDGAPPRRVAIDLDGRRLHEVAIPCTTVLLVPPETFDLEVTVPPGEHVLRVADLTTGRDARRTLRFPILVAEPDGKGATVADNLRVWLDEGGVEIGEVRLGASMGF